MTILFMMVDAWYMSTAVAAHSLGHHTIQNRGTTSQTEHMTAFVARARPYQRQQYWHQQRKRQCPFPLSSRQLHGLRRWWRQREDHPGGAFRRPMGLWRPSFVVRRSSFFPENWAVICRCTCRSLCMLSTWCWPFGSCVSSVRGPLGPIG
jgi:hypothetical protein